MESPRAILTMSATGAETPGYSPLTWNGIICPISGFCYLFECEIRSPGGQYPGPWFLGVRLCLHKSTQMALLVLILF
jgi:uncharacterized RDD family membrane protein YckC